jgi:hypothetical protein
MPRDVSSRAGAWEENSMAKICKHEPDFKSAAVIDRCYEACSVRIQCLHCEENAFADLGPEHFKWNPPDDAE